MKRGCNVDNILRITNINTFFKRQYADGYSFKGEYHDFYEVVCVISGEILVTAGKEIYTLKEGEMTYHPPGEFHAFREDTGSHPNIIIFSFNAVLFPDVRGRIFSLSKNDTEELEKLYKLLLKSFDFEPPTKSGSIIWVRDIKKGEEMNAALLVKRLELFLISTLSNEANEGDHKKKTKWSQSFYNILTVMEDNITKALCVEEIALLCDMSIPTLEKTVHHFLGYGAMTHYNVLRMQKAYNLLKDGHSVKEVSFELGFLNQNYFSARFKKHYGFSPSGLSGSKSS